MAKTKPHTKTKHVNDDEDVPKESADEIDVDADEPIAEDDADQPQEPDEPIGESDAGDDAPPDDDGSVDLPPPKRKPKAKVSKLTIALILLNWIAAPTFLVFAWYDNLERTRYSYYTLFHYAQIWGLPLQEEEDFPSLGNYTRPVTRVTPEQLRKAFDDRRTGASFPKSEPFVVVEEPVPFRLKPSQMTDTVVDELFGTVPDKVPTLDKAIADLKEKLPRLIDAAAEEALKNAKTDDDKRKIVEKTLLPLAWDVWQVKKLDDALQAAQKDDLDNLVKEGVKRRIYYDILAPINMFRAGDLSTKDDKKKFRIERIADLDIKIEEIKGFLDKRLDLAIAPKYDTTIQIGADWDEQKTGPLAMERDSVEKRKCIAFIFFTVGQVQNPITQKKLYDKGVERAQVICGIYEFTNASIDYVRTQRVLEERIAEAVKNDRQGWILTLPDKTRTRTPGFIDQYEREVDRLIKVVEQIDSAEKRLADAQGQLAKFRKVYDQRVQQHKDALERLVKARGTTEKYAKELRELQLQLHEALRELSDAAERNFEIEGEIRAIELNYLRTLQPKKGAKQP